MAPRRIALSAGAVVHADDESGHSHKGTAFDSGMRKRPWFDQGNTLWISC